MTILLSTLLVFGGSSVLAVGGIAFIRSVIYFLLASVIPGVPQEASEVASLLAFVAIVAATRLNVGVLHSAGQASRGPVGFSQPSLEQGTSLLRTQSCCPRSL